MITLSLMLALFLLLLTREILHSWFSISYCLGWNETVNRLGV